MAHVGVAEREQAIPSAPGDVGQVPIGFFSAGFAVRRALYVLEHDLKKQRGCLGKFPGVLIAGIQSGVNTPGPAKQGVGVANDAPEQPVNNAGYFCRERQLLLQSALTHGFCN